MEIISKAMARFFWVAIEFGLMRERSDTEVYGSGLLNSFGEIGPAIQATHVERRPFDLETVVHQQFEIDHFQPLLFIVESFEHFFALVDELERWMKTGRLHHVEGENLPSTKII